MSRFNHVPFGDTLRRDAISSLLNTCHGQMEFEYVCYHWETCSGCFKVDIFVRGVAVVPVLSVWLKIITANRHKVQLLVFRLHFNFK